MPRNRSNTRLVVASTIKKEEILDMFKRILYRHMPRAALRKNNY